MKVEWQRRAVKSLRSFLPEDQAALVVRVEALACEGRGDVRALRGQKSKPPVYRLRWRDYRVLFVVSEGALSVLDVRNRRDAYR